MTTHVRMLSAALVAAGCLVVGTTAGAVAGAQITGAQIKNGTITTADVKDGTLVKKDLSAAAVAALAGAAGPAGPAGAPGPAGPTGPQGASGVLGRQEVDTSLALAANTAKSNLTATCPSGKVAVGGSGFWTNSSAAVQFSINLNAVRAFTPGISTADTLNVRAICVNQ